MALQAFRKLLKMKKIFLYTLGGFLILFLLFVLYFVSVARIDPPALNNAVSIGKERIQLNKDFYVLDKSWIKKSESGLWEMYVEAEDPFERGTINGKLAKHLVQKQEFHFINQIKKLIPSEVYLNYLKYAIAWFNRDLHNYVDEEFKQEIYGVSNSLSDAYDFVGSKYQRSLNYHAAHDIGHALQDKNMVVGCTSFSAWDAKSEDGNLLVGRNFDFYVGDEFAEDKIVCFYNPVKGNKFVYITWGGFVGAVSGMNDKGLTVTINASKSDIPTGSATPISLVAREILQYASNFEEALKIAEKRKTFVSESILIGSAKDRKSGIIEKSPNKTASYFSNTNFIICANNFQSEAFSKDPINIENKNTSSSVYRYNRMLEMLNEYPTLNPSQMAQILRNREGLKKRDIGMGNEKSINQLIAHHAVIMEPAKGLIWVSTNPFQLGEFKCYNLSKIFSGYAGLKQKTEIHEANLTIAADSFLFSNEYANFVHYKSILRYLNTCIQQDLPFNEKMEKALLLSNPEQFEGYSLLGDYYLKQKDFTQATAYYNLALQKEIPLQKNVLQIQAQLKKCVI
jgi:isopenicillin-N N-acyltransferase-like protein